MRKTKPIELPEQDLVPVPAAYTNDAFQYNESEPNPPSSTTDESTTDSFNSFNTVYFDANSQCNTLPYVTVPVSPEEDNQQNSSVAINHASTSSSSADVLQQNDIINVILNTSNESNHGSGGGGGSNAPRQLGRRSESRPRIVSIDVSTPTHDALRRTPVHHRPTSTPVPRVHLEPPSEDSSIGNSTRNPSPISVVSSIASSSATSTVNETNNQR